MMIWLLTKSFAGGGSGVRMDLGASPLGHVIGQITGRIEVKMTMAAHARRLKHMHVALP